MNIDHNHLVPADRFGSPEEAMRYGYIPVPDHLSKRAEKLLHGRSEGAYGPDPRSVRNHALRLLCMLPTRARREKAVA